MPVSSKKADLDKLLERLRDPVQLRVFITVVMVLVGYLGIFMPLDGRIRETSRKLNETRKRQALASDIELLRAEVAKFQDRLPEDTDTNEWVQYVLAGSRRFPLRVNNLDSASPKRLGPYEAVTLHVELAGRFEDLDSFLHWLESNERLFRVDSAKIMPPRGGKDELLMQLTLLGAKA
jgi:Tfp pilus assembly protein PilO